MPNFCISKGLKLDVNQES